MFLAAHSSSLVWWPLPNVSHSTHLHSIAFSLYQVHFLYLSHRTFFQPQSKQSGNGHFLAYITIVRVKSCQPGEGGRRAFSLSLYLPLRTKIHSPYLSSTPTCTLWFQKFNYFLNMKVCWQKLTNKIWKIIYKCVSKQTLHWKRGGFVCFIARKERKRKGSGKSALTEAEFLVILFTCIKLGGPRHLRLTLQPTPLYAVWCSLILVCVSQIHNTDGLILLVRRNLLLIRWPSQKIWKYNRDRVKSSGKAIFSNIWTIWAMDRTPGQP